MTHLGQSDSDVKLLTAQRDEALREAEKFSKAGEYLAAALRFYVPGLTRPGQCGDPFYSDAHAALKRWENATEEANHA